MATGGLLSPFPTQSLNYIVTYKSTMCHHKTIAIYPADCRILISESKFTILYSNINFISASLFHHFTEALNKKPKLSIKNDAY